MENYEEMIEQTALAGEVGRQAQVTAAAQYYLEEREKTLVEAQLEVDKTLKDLYRRLRQDVFGIDEQNNIKWTSIEDKRKGRLTDEGVARIMEVMGWFVNKENLLSNFDEEQISLAMKRFRDALSGNIFMRYKLYFRQPSIEECFTIFKERITDKAKIKVFAAEILGIKKEQQIEEEFLLLEYEEKLEEEIEKIKEIKKKEMLSEFELLFVQLSQLVFATLSRAYRGEERGSIRRHQNVTEIIGARPSQSGKDTGGVMKWLKG